MAGEAVFLTRFTSFCDWFQERFALRTMIGSEFRTLTCLTVLRVRGVNGYGSTTYMVNPTARTSATINVYVNNDDFIFGIVVY